jgi:hypothetical protein
LPRLLQEGEKAEISAWRMVGCVGVRVERRVVRVL